MRRTLMTLGLTVIAAVAAPGARAGVDWTTYAYDLQRTGYNPQETVIGTGNAGALVRWWSAAFGTQIITQPLVATGVETASGVRDLVYVATRSVGRVAAVDRSTGATVWDKMLGPGGSPVTGIAGTPALDRARQAIYVATQGGDLHALDEATGTELGGWPVRVTPADLTSDRVYAAVTLAGASIYVEMAGESDQPPTGAR